ncbi:MAG: hypothetical protein WA738_04765 [Candidatus Angelobacter sp.]
MKKALRIVLFAGLALTANTAFSDVKQAFDGPGPMCIPPVNCQLR